MMPRETSGRPRRADFEAVRSVWPSSRALGARIPGSDYVPNAWGPEDAAAYAQELKARGCDFVTVSGGGVVPDAKVPTGPGYQVPFAEAVKRATGVTTGAVGLITEPRQAETIVASGRADYVAIARAFLFNPYSFFGTEMTPIAVTAFSSTWPKMPITGEPSPPSSSAPSRRLPKKGLT